MLLLWSFDAGVRCSSGVRRPSVSFSHNIIGMKSAIFGDIRSTIPLKERADAVGFFPSHFYFFSIQFLCITTRSYDLSGLFSLRAVWLHSFMQHAAPQAPPHDDRQLALFLTTRTVSATTSTITRTHPPKRIFGHRRFSSKSTAYRLFFVSLSRLYFTLSLGVAFHTKH